ncbi:hypothetical protein [Pleomorphochaeta sp. DL1XJH-081]|uniref:hypothetical protein n=1 Tax=Pleomorphochaeta sp. DL1XJH-081 TaxID=3409690 RepID=UPI003BB70BAF
MSKQYNNAGRSLIVDEVVELKGLKKDSVSTLRQQLDAQLIKRDTAEIKAQVSLIGADNHVTVSEKLILEREYKIIESNHGILVSKAEEWGVTEQEGYQEYLVAYQNLSSFLDVLLSDMTLGSDIDSHLYMSGLFDELYRTSSLLEEQFFRFTTGMLGGLDWRIKFEVVVNSSTGITVPLDNTPTTLSVMLLREGEDVTNEYDSSAFEWARVSEDRVADSSWRDGVDLSGKTITVSHDDLIYGSASFLCRFRYQYSDTMYYSKSGFVTLSEEVPGPPGEQGIQGPPGADGQPSYFHLKYSNDNGATFTDFLGEVPGKYMGTYVDSSSDDSEDPADYTWVLVKGENGEQGIQGPMGPDGVSSYLHIKYSNDGGTTFTANNGEDVGDYLGQYVDHTEADSSDPSVYVWKKIKGEQGEQGPQGIQGPQGDQGTQGPAGADGQPSYFHVKYSDYSDGTGMNDVGGAYIGTYVDNDPTDSTDKTLYTWVLIEGAQGPQGNQGIPGVDGENGETSYLHLKYSDDGGVTFTANDGETVGDYLGQYVDFTEGDSPYPADYTWKKIKGETGEQGPQGLQGIQGPQGDQGIEGPKGDDGVSSYTHIAYATGSNGENFSVSHFSTATYIGMYVDQTPADSGVWSVYKWTLIKGADGAQGIPGQTGADGLTAYFHTAWANNDTGTSGFSTTVSSGKLYIGTYTDHTEGDSSDPTRYKWVKVKGETGDTGPTGTSITSVDVEYAISTSSTTAPTTGWTTNSPAWEDGKYIWSRTKTTYSVGDPTYTNPACITGGKGEAGSTGPIGQGVESITEEYYLSTSKTTQTGGIWATSPPTWSTGKYLWTRSKIVYKNPADTKYTTPVCDNSWEAVNVVQDDLNARDSQYGYKYKADIIIYGDSDKLYPVVIKSGDQTVMRDIMVKRSYSELAPPDWNTSTHKGNLTLKVKANFGGWGGAEYFWTIHELSEMYSRMFGGCLHTMSSMGFAIYLRGGGTTGAAYHLYSDQSLTTTLYGGVSPQICYNNELMGETGPYTWYAPSLKTFATLKPDTLHEADEKLLESKTVIIGPTIRPSLQSSGTTLSVVGGKLDINGEEYRVPTYSQDLVSSEGQGYISFDGSDVQFVRMFPNATAKIIEWKTYVGYNSTSVQWIIGRFKKDGATIQQETLITPIPSDIFTKDKFMDILAEEDLGEMSLWAQALGVQQFFESLATVDFFANNITTRRLEIIRGLYRFLIDYNDGATNPIIQSSYDGTIGFEINPTSGLVRIVGTGEFEGSVKHEAFETVKGQNGATITIPTTKELWSTDELYGELSTVSTNGTINSASGSYKGVAFNGISRLPSSTSRGLISTSSRLDQSSYRNENYYLLHSAFTVPAGCYYITIKFDAAMQSTIYDGLVSIVKNPIHTNVNSAASNPGTVVRDASNNSMTTYPEFNTFTYSFYCTPGETYSIWLRGEESRDKNYYTYVKNAYYYFYTVAGPGVLLRYTNNTYGVISPGQYRNEAFSLSSPQSWVHTSNLNFMKGDVAFNNAVIQTLTEGIRQPATGSITIEEVGGSPETFTVQSVVLNANSVSFGTSEAGDKTITKWGEDGSTQGVYESFNTAGITLSVAQRSIRVSSILPKTHPDSPEMDFHLIGSANEPFVGGYFNNLDLDGKPMYGCRAWVNFNGVGVVSPRASRNVSTVVDAGEGRYRINFAVPMKSTNYAVTTGSRQDADANENAYDLRISKLEAITLGSVLVSHGYYTTSNVYRDCSYGYVAIFE